jgi:hypothetical protein
MNKFLRSLLFFLLIPIAAAAFYWETSLNISAANHDVLQIIIVLSFCGLALNWIRYDEKCRLREIAQLKPERKPYITIPLSQPGEFYSKPHDSGNPRPRA